MLLHVKPRSKAISSMNSLRFLLGETKLAVFIRLMSLRILFMTFLKIKSSVGDDLEISRSSFICLIKIVCQLAPSCLDAESTLEAKHPTPSTKHQQCFRQKIPSIEWVEKCIMKSLALTLPQWRLPIVETHRKAIDWKARSRTALESSTRVLLRLRSR